MANVYIALLHSPVYNKRKDVVTTSITGFDLHDIARSAATFGLKKYFVVNPLPAQREFASRIVNFWLDPASLEFNWTRAEAFKLISIKESLAEAIAEIKAEEGKRPTVIITSAKPKGTITFKKLKEKISRSKSPYLILFGTGWGLVEEVFAQADLVLEPIPGRAGLGRDGERYNHLSVRSATAIILDRLLSK